MKELLNSAWFADLLADHQPPCISIYQPLQRAAPPADQNPLRFRGLVEKMQEAIKARYDDAVVRSMTQRIESIVTGPEFWTRARDGIVVFASPDYLKVIDLIQPVDSLVVVADNFHIKPLIRIYQSADRYQLLCLELKSVRLFEGTRWQLEKIELRNVPTDLWQVAGMTLSKTTDSGQDLAQAQRQADEGSRRTEAVPVEHFLRAVDKAIWENYSRISGLPLILCADERTHAQFRQVSKNPFLMKQGIMLSPRGLPLDRIRDEAWKLMQPFYDQRLDKLTNDFRAAKAHQRGSDELTQVAEAASRGRIGTLLVADDAHVPGRILRHSGLLEQAPASNAQADDVLDDLAEMVLRQDGQVLVVPQNAMPTDTGVAAIYRY